MSRADPPRAVNASGSRATFTFDAIGTRWEVDTDEPLPRDVRHEVVQRVRRFDATYSRFRPDSLVSQVATAAEGGRFEFPDDSIALFDLYDRLVVATEGAVDPLVGRDLELLGYDAEYSLTPVSNAMRAQERACGRVAWAADVVRDGKMLRTRRPLVIDIGAVGKGYVVDIVSAILRAAGVGGFVVDASGDLRHSGGGGLRVGLEHPFDTQRVIGVANLRDHALCSSATTRRAWRDGLHHMLDARTGVPVHEVAATWVVAESAALADGLATALFFSPSRQLAETFRFTHVRMLADGRAEISQEFDGALFT